jgi:cytochrome P450
MSVALGTIPILDVDPFSAASLESPFAVQAALRDAGPVTWLSRHGCFAVARHEDVRKVLIDYTSFCSSRGIGLTDFKKNPPYRQPSVILEADPPLHTATHKVLAAVLNAGVMNTLRETFAQAAAALVDRQLSAGPDCDGIADIAEAFPLAVFPDAVGLAKAGRAHLLPYGDFVFNSVGPKNEILAKALDALPPHLDWIMAQTKREALSHDGLGAAIYAAADRGEIAAEHAPLLVRSLLSAGLDTTVNGIAAALLCFATAPDQWERLRAERHLARHAFEEAIRLESPVQQFFRTTTRDVEIAGAVIPEGEKVMVSFAAANRDPRRWDRADEYDIGRNTAGHVGYGAGIHLCVGMLLARLEGEVMLDALAARVARIELIGPLIRHHNNSLRGIRTLPLRLHAARP